jgi:TIR- and PNP-associating SLOG family
MDLRGRRIHIVGSADPETDDTKLNYTHQLVFGLVAALAAEGATFVVPFGKEPFLKDRDIGPSIIFDWTIAEAVRDALKAGVARAAGPNGRLVATLATSKTDAHIPPVRRPVYDDLRDGDAVHLEFLDPGWNAGASRRRRLAQLGDVFIGISGGEGVEHLAVEYSSRGKPVIPLDIALGASQRDGSGGAARLFERALAQPAGFFRVVDGASPADLLDRTRARDGQTSTDKVISAVMKLLQSLTPPRVFYVRLLNPKLPEYPSVEAFFRDSVDTLVRELGYEPLQMGMGKNEFAWMNQAIFDSLHHSSVVLIDLTTLRPNCFMEFGYALGNRQKVIVTARNDTSLPFDSSSLEAFLWSETEAPDERVKRLRQHWERNIEMPAIVSPKEAR